MKEGTKFLSTQIFKKPSILAIFGRKNGKDKNFWSNSFLWSESIQNGPKRILIRNLDFENFSHYDVSLGT